MESFLVGVGDSYTGDNPPLTATVENPPLTPTVEGKSYRIRLNTYYMRWGDGEMGRWGDGEMGRWGI
ncbi:MAG: hypothetical protein SWX82_00735 [Cyanobacteriota bacterium]|nr:hypothetical protein [Cyanobacteriota bacterium]